MNSRTWDKTQLPALKCAAVKVRELWITWKRQGRNICKRSDKRTDAHLRDVRFRGFSLCGIQIGPEIKRGKADHDKCRTCERRLRELKAGKAYLRGDL